MGVSYMDFAAAMLRHDLVQNGLSRTLEPLPTWLLWKPLYSSTVPNRMVTA